MSKIELRQLEETASYQFNRPHLLQEALTHKSFINEITEKSLKDNERLEYLGDAVLDLVVSRYLFDKLPEAQEGELSKIKSTIVSEPTLAIIARKLNLGDFLILGKGEELSQGRNKSSLLANALEALIAAIYIDSGLRSAEAFIHLWFTETIDNILTSQITFDCKTDFQEQCQKVYEVLPEYKLIKTTGPDHEKVFEIHLLVKGDLFGVGTGKSKKEAEQKAAREALNRIKGEEKS
jgi:ribonuclease-3